MPKSTRKFTIYKKMKNNPKNIRFKDFVNALIAFGFKLSRQRGSHQLYFRGNIFMNMQSNSKDKSKDKSKAKPYQVKEFIKLIEDNNLLEIDEDE